MAMPAEPAPLGASTTSKMRRSPATMAGSRLESGAPSARARARLFARRAVEQFERARHRVGRILGFHRPGIGRIHEAQPAIPVARPYRGGQRIEQRLHGLDVAHQPVVAGGEIHEFALDAADVAQAEHGAPGHGAAFRLERMAGGGGERHDEAAAVVAQPVDRVLHALRGRRLQPAAEGEHALGHRAGHDDAGVAENFRLVGARRPGHQHLRLRQQQRLEPVDFGAQRQNLVVRRGFRSWRAALRVRNSTMVASTAKQSKASVSVRAATCSWLTSVTARTRPSARLKEASAPACAGVLQSAAKAEAARNPPRLGRERSLSFAVRIVSGIQTCPRKASGVRRAARESPDFTPAGSHAERVQIVNGSRIGRAVALFQRFGPLRHVLDADGGERRRKRTLGFDQRRLHHVIGQRRVAAAADRRHPRPRRRRAGCPRR